jgi:hypothetical protein
MGEHAKLQPSAAKRWQQCPASVRESENVPRTDTEDSLKGTAAHWAMAVWLQEGQPPLVGTKAPNGVELTQELLEIAGEHVGWVKGYIAQQKATCSLLVEERTQIGSYFGLDPALLWGTTDTAILAPTELVVADLKAGWQDVQAEENDQLILYALGLCEELGWLWDQIRLVIIQPRQGQPKEWVVSREELQKFAEDFKEPIANALSPDPRYGPSEDACRYCDAAARCKALHDEQLALAKREFDFVVTDGDAVTVAPHVTVEQVAEVLAKEKFIKAALSAMREHALRLIQLGTDVPGFKAVEGKKNRIWKPGAEQHVKEKLGEKAYKAPELISPAQAEKLDKSLAAFAEKPKGAPTLAPVTDKRAALPPHFDIVDVGDLLE